MTNAATALPHSRINPMRRLIARAVDIAGALFCAWSGIVANTLPWPIFIMLGLVGVGALFIGGSLHLELDREPR